MNYDRFPGTTIQEDQRNERLSERTGELIEDYMAEHLNCDEAIRDLVYDYEVDIWGAVKRIVSPNGQDSEDRKLDRAEAVSDLIDIVEKAARAAVQQKATEAAESEGPEYNREPDDE